MSRLFQNNNELCLDISDSYLLKNNFEAKTYFISTWGFTKENDLLTKQCSSRELSMVVPEIFNYIKNLGENCELDDNCTQLIIDQNNDNNDFEFAKTNGNLIKDSNQIDLELPFSFKRKLKSYQKMPTEHMIKLGNSANFSVPGSGKTTITYAALSYWLDKKEIDKILVIGPLASFMPWTEEYKKCFNVIPKEIRINSQTVKYLSSIMDEYDIVLCSYPTLSNHSEYIRKALMKHKTAVVIDESHNIKGDSNRAHAALEIAPFAKKRIILSGTPLPQSYLDLFNQMTFLWPSANLLGTYPAFKSESQDSSNEHFIQQKISPYFVRIKKSDLKLKKPKFRKIMIDLDDAQRVIYDAIAKKYLLDETTQERKKLDKWRRGRMIRLLQTASNPTLLSGKSRSQQYKIKPLDPFNEDIEKLIENYPNFGISNKLVTISAEAKKILDRGEKLIIWCSFIDNILFLKDYLLKKYRPLTIYGDIPRDADADPVVNREDNINKFKNSLDHNLLIANPSSCAESISLHVNDKGKSVCKTAFYLDRTFNAGQFVQSMDRIHRIGLDPDIQVEYVLFLCKNTIDETIDARLNKKISKMESLLEDEITILNLESDVTQISDIEFEEDYRAVFDDLKKIYDGKNI